MKAKTVIGLFSVFGAFLLLFGRCSMDKIPVSVEEVKGTLKMYLLDSPADYEAVNIEIARVEVHYARLGDTTANAGWVIVNDTPRMFNLLDLVNGVSAVLGEADLLPGHYTQIRLILTQNSQVVVDGKTCDLFVPSGIQTGIKLTHEFDIQPGKLYELYLDFDVNKSIVATGSHMAPDNYILKPHIRVIPKVISGTISGKVLPLDADPWVLALANSDTVNSAIPDTTDGSFVINALPEGNYSVSITDLSQTYADTTITDVEVTAQSETNLGTITLRQ